jgi:hypothetical protein
VTGEFTADRFEAIALQLTPRVRRVVPAAALHIYEGAHSYCCASWRIHGRAQRELFVEQPGSAIAPLILRVGIYFQDAPTATVQPGARHAALTTLAAHRLVLQEMDVSCTFTPGSETRDDVAFGWSDEDLIEWLSATSENRDLVWRCDLRQGEPSTQQLEERLSALLPVWLDWNSL